MAGSPDDAADAPTAEDDFLLSEFDGEHDAADDAGGLELGDAQAEEIRTIFLTTLPQYLEPLEELLEQALAADSPDPSAIKTMVTTVDSILAAANRIGVDDVVPPLEAMRELIVELAQTSPGEVEVELRHAFQQVKLRSGIEGGDRERHAGPTIVAALAAVPDFDRSILEALTAAGLVTVSQLEMARHDEIVAVSGLAPEAVTALLTALGIDKSVATRAHAAAATPPSDSPLERALVAQVHAEEALSVARADLQHARLRIEALRVEARTLEADIARHEAASRDAMERASRASRDLVAGRQEVRELEARRDALRGRLASAKEGLARLETDLDSQKREDAEAREQLEDLNERVRRLLEAAESVR